MTSQKEIEFVLNTFKRRLSFQTENHVNSSLFYHAIFSVLSSIKDQNEESFEKELKEKSKIKFAGFYPPCKVTVTVEFEKLDL